MNVLAPIRLWPRHDIEAGHDRPLVIGLLNNASEAAFRTTERQFARLLNNASPGPAVILRSYALPEIHPDPIACLRHSHSHLSMDMLRCVPPDGLIVSGAEPGSASLKDEPYWRSLVAVLDWARAARLPTILSCLAAHAAVLHASGIERRRLVRKCTGIYPISAAANHWLLPKLGPNPCMPHSRWHELDERALVQAGYVVLTRSAQAGVDMFASPDEDAWLFFNGHPEYDEDTLMKQYRRDIGQFLRGERADYPDLPCQDMAPATARRLAMVRRLALAGLPTRAIEAFPATEQAGTPAWRQMAAGVVGNWLMRVRDRVA